MLLGCDGVTEVSYQRAGGDELALDTLPKGRLGGGGWFCFIRTNYKSHFKNISELRVKLKCRFQTLSAFLHIKTAECLQHMLHTVATVSLGQVRVPCCISSLKKVTVLLLYLHLMGHFSVVLLLKLSPSSWWKKQVRADYKWEMLHQDVTSLSCRSAHKQK